MIQRSIEDPLLWIACRRHVLELYLGVVWKVCFGKSKAPADALCEVLSDFIDEEGLPDSLDAENSPHVLTFDATDDLLSEQKKRLEDLATHLDGEKVGSKAKPRNDYGSMWGLVKVQLYIFEIL